VSSKGRTRDFESLNRGSIPRAGTVRTGETVLASPGAHVGGIALVALVFTAGIVSCSDVAAGPDGGADTQTAGHGGDSGALPDSRAPGALGSGGHGGSSGTDHCRPDARAPTVSDSSTSGATGGASGTHHEPTDGRDASSSGGPTSPNGRLDAGSDATIGPEAGTHDGGQRGTPSSDAGRTNSADASSVKTDGGPDPGGPYLCGPFGTPCHYIEDIPGICIHDECWPGSCLESSDCARPAICDPASLNATIVNGKLVGFCGRCTTDDQCVAAYGTGVSCAPSGACTRADGGLPYACGPDGAVCRMGGVLGICINDDCWPGV
jgi:hypothetical protein